MYVDGDEDGDGKGVGKGEEWEPGEEVSWKTDDMVAMVFRQLESCI